MEGLKVIFLDFDGVIVIPPDYRGVNQDKLTLLQKIVNETGAKIVISSTWRILHDLDDLKSRLPGCEVIGITPRMEGERGYEIWEWILENQPSMFVVLDDDGDKGPLTWGRWLKTKFDVGLTEEIANRAIKVLNS